MRYFLEVAYDGTRFHGWQLQPNALTVQEVLDDGLRKVFRLPQVETVGSGRTDTGVHAAQQWVHVDLPQVLPPAEIQHKLNRILPPDIVVGQVMPVGPEAHTRFDAISRTYEYRITRQKNPFLVRHAHYLSRTPDVDSMNQAAQALLHLEDFTTFSKVKGDTKHYRCTITHAHWREEGDLLIFTIKANRFLRGMVRLVVGTLLDVGKGKLTAVQFRDAIERQDRRLASGAAPAEGLFLYRVEYPAGYFAQQKALFELAAKAAMKE
ncbi:tRNA pseudouridine(38-40) synthase TruA [Rufibacter glacialis]|uniref:tRNA pseudouridine synthase A n=1 Tax=Rufibacter glacialis TaxID=1259555 RepID=A0A5M8QE60_9BACT|nr:tRNA pseudouridine(38-40) synthase TruA [Rufibacter glacialis]KAA6433478.1 tRNA pseudouridine(38-40) synthase TruA [Rufibacter glacialis]GGK73864.1 tRNA pseudouridine synthase A [Rufibacter glacialis]